MTTKVRIDVKISNSYIAHLTKIPLAGFLKLVENYLPSTLKRVSVFEDFSENLAGILRTTNSHFYLLPPGPWDGQMVDIHRKADPQISRAFAARSVDLEQLSLAYMVNAEDFFSCAAGNSSWTWDRLESLALTSQLLRQDATTNEKTRKEIDDMLYVAGITAQRMPKLQALALWNGIKGEACAFIYYRKSGRASLTCRGTWDILLSPRVVTAWEGVAMGSHLCGTLQISKERVSSDIRSHGDAIHYLDLPCPVVTPASLWQIRREGM